MLNSSLVEVAVGLLVVFYALALFCSGFVEFLATRMKKRAKYLIRGMQDLLRDTTSGTLKPWKLQEWKDEAVQEGQLYKGALNAAIRADRQAAVALDVNSIMGHGLVTPYKQTTATGRVTRNPSYLPSQVFSRVILDLLTSTRAQGAVGVTMTEVRAAAAAVTGNKEFTDALNGLVKAAGDDIDAFLTSIEQWFDAQMDRISGSYKRWAKRWVIVVATVVVLAGGVDSIAIARSLHANDAVQTTVAETATAQLCPAGTAPAVCAENAKAFYEKSGLPIGWSAPNPNDGQWGILLKILGLLISIGAACVGAPFWFKVLDKVGALRNTGSRPPSSLTIVP